MLIESGHLNVFDYGWSFFEIAISERGNREKEALMNMAVAVRVGNHADKTEWKKFSRKMKAKE